MNSTLYNMFLAQLGRADDKDMEEFMAKYNLDPYGETSARMDGMGLGQSEMLASRERWAAGQESTDAQMDAQYAFHIKHGWHGRPAMLPTVASAPMDVTQEEMQPKRKKTKGNRE